MDRDHCVPSTRMDYRMEAQSGCGWFKEEEWRCQRKELRTAIDTNEQGTIVTCFGDSASVLEGSAGDELKALMNALEEGEGEPLPSTYGFFLAAPCPGPTSQQ